MQLGSKVIETCNFGEYINKVFLDRAKLTQARIKPFHKHNPKWVYMTCPQLPPYAMTTPCLPSLCARHSSSLSLTASILVAQPSPHWPWCRSRACVSSGCPWKPSTLAKMQRTDVGCWETWCFIQLCLVRMVWSFNDSSCVVSKF